MDHLEAIVELKKVIAPFFCKKIIALTNKKCFENLKIRGGLDTNIRNVKGYHLNFNTATNLFYWNYIRGEIERLYPYYKIKFPKMTSNKINQIDLLKYKPGGKYEVHTDHFSTSPRHLSVIMNLNDEYEGGDLVFRDQKNLEIKRLKLTAGSIIFFPSNFMYPHCIEPITKGVRYSIVSWLQ